MCALIAASVDVTLASKADRPFSTKKSLIDWWMAIAYRNSSSDKGRVAKQTYWISFREAGSIL